MDTKNENLLASRVGGSENKTFSEISMESQDILLKELVEEAKIMKKKNEREGAVVFIPNPIMYQLEMLKYIQEGEKLPKKHIIAAILKLFLMKTAEAVSQKSKKLTLGENITEGTMNEVCINGKAVYSTGGAAKEYGTIACNLHNGCRGGCRYCYLKFGVWKKRLGGDEPVIQASFYDANHAYAVFSKEFRKYHKEIVEGGGVFFSFSTDPCDPSVFPLYYRCMMKTLGYNAMGETDKASPGPVTVTLLTKRSEWVDTPEGQMLLSKGGKNLRVGFTLTGHDEMERGASPGEERIKAMAAAFRQGCHTWVSLEPVLDDDAGKAKDLVLKTADFCCEYKVGLLSVPTRNVMGVHYDRDKIEEFGRWITNFCRDNHKLLYLKDSYTKLVEK